MAQVRLALLGAVIVLAVLANAVGLLTIVIDHRRAFDWDNWIEAVRRYPLGTLYDWNHPYAYHYAPQLALLFGPLTAIGLSAWRAAHLLALPLMPSYRLAALLLVSYPFWADVDNGNLMTFVLLAAAWALRGNRVAIAVYLLLCVLIPRPIMLPLLVWILWKQPSWRLPFVVLALGVLLTAAPTSYLTAWIGALLGSSPNDIANAFNVSPSHVIGLWWLAIGIPLGAWLTYRGRLGWASMAISPYLLPYWVELLGLELVRPEPASRQDPAPPTQ